MQISHWVAPRCSGKHTGRCSEGGSLLQEIRGAQNGATGTEMLLLPALGEALLLARASVMVLMDIPAFHVRSWDSWFLVWEVMFPLPILNGRMQPELKMLKH